MKEDQMTDERERIAKVLSDLAKDMRAEVRGECGSYAAGYRRGADEVARAAKLIRRGREGEILGDTE